MFNKDLIYGILFDYECYCNYYGCRREPGCSFFLRQCLRAIWIWSHWVKRYVCITNAEYCAKRHFPASVQQLVLAERPAPVLGLCAGMTCCWTSGVSTGKCLHGGFLGWGENWAEAGQIHGKIGSGRWQILLMNPVLSPGRQTQSSLQIQGKVLPTPGLVMG